MLALNFLSGCASPLAETGTTTIVFGALLLVLAPVTTATVAALPAALELPACPLS